MPAERRGRSENDKPMLVIDYDGGKQAQDLIETLDENFHHRAKPAAGPMKQYQAGRRSRLRKTRPGLR